MIKKKNNFKFKSIFSKNIINFEMLFWSKTMVNYTLFKFSRIKLR